MSVIKVNRSFISILLIGVPLNFYAQQDRFIGGVLLNFNGIEFKGNTTQFWNGPSSEISGTLGFSAGLFVNRELSKSIYTKLEIRYIEKGSIYEFTSQYGSEAFQSVSLKYVEIPLLLGYKIKPFKKTYYLECGFGFAKLISSGVEENNSTPRIGTPTATEFKLNDISWIVSYKFPLIKKWDEKCLFGLRVSRSITTINKYINISNFDYGIEVVYLFN